MPRNSRVKLTGCQLRWQASDSLWQRFAFS